MDLFRVEDRHGNDNDRSRTYYLPNTEIEIVRLWMSFGRDGVRPMIGCQQLNGSPEAAEMLAAALLDAAKVGREWR